MYKVFLAALAAVTFSMPALATGVTLDFEDAFDQASLLDFYNGGQDSLGNSGSKNFGIRLSDSFKASKESLSDGSFTGEPSYETAIYFTQPTGLFSFSPEPGFGFTTSFSFYYSSLVGLSFYVYDGNGVELTNGFWGDQSTNGCGTDFCNWTSVSVNFSGIAKSVLFLTSANETYLDNVTFACTQPGGCTANENPEPGSLALVGLALAGLGFAGRRART